MTRCYKKTKRRVAALLLCALLLALLAGCGEQSAPEPEATPEPPAATPDVSETSVELSELMAANRTVLADEDGEFPDWLELHNTAAEPCELTGYWLSDDPKELQKWPIPSLTLQGGEYKVIFASGKDRAETLHTNFKLPRSGGTLYLSSPEGWLLWQRSWEEAGKDHSVVFSGETAAECSWPSPGYENSDAGFLAAQSENDRHGALVINEAVGYNDDFNPHARDTFDWVELKNVSDESVLLSDYFLTDDDADPAQFRLPERNLGPGELFLVYCGTPTEGTSYVHAPFSLDSKGDQLYLYAADGSLSDRLGLYDVPLNGSKGRVDGESGSFFFRSRTPGAQNTQDGGRMVSEKPVSLTAEGVHGEGTLRVELSAPGTLYYTLDGSVPTVYSAVYDGPLELYGPTSVRAISVEEGKLQSAVATFSYIVGESHSLPVVSLTMDPGEFSFMYSYTHAERDANLAYFGPDGTFDSDCMVTMHGASSRTVWNKKNFKMVFKDRYGGDIDFDLFGNGITQFHSLVLRGGSSAGMLTFRDPLAALVSNEVAAVDPLALDCRSCVFYVNGEYRGVYGIREAYSRKYLADHTGSDEDSCVIVRAPVTIDANSEMFDLHNFMIQRDVTNAENYAYINDRFDLTSLAQWLCLETYFNNLDPTGNIRYCKGNYPDNKWRVMLFDFDIAMTNNQASMYAMIDPASQIGRILSNMRKSSDFRQLTLETASQLRKNGLNYQLCLDVFNGMVDEVDSEIMRTMAMYNEATWSYEATVEWQRATFTENRDRTWLECIRSYCGADEETMHQYFPEDY